MKSHFAVGVFALLAASAASAVTSREATAGFLYSYYVDAPASFDAAYREHLQWHREKGDHLTWYGWYVVAGARTGMFVDGTFGSDFEAIDRRPAVAEDARHFAQGAALHSRPAPNSIWQLWPEVSTDFGLEDQDPTPLLHVLELRVDRSRLVDFERLLIRLATGRASEPGLDWTWYRGAAGTEHPAFLILIPRKRWSELELGAQSLATLAARAYGRSRDEQFATLDDMATALVSEVWRYRTDLSYFPGDDR